MSCSASEEGRMTEKNAVITGRRNAARDYQAGAYCASCGIRRLIGEPEKSHVWAGRLHNVPLTPEQMDLILVAAAEYVRLSNEAGETSGPVGFVDWLRPDALGTVTASRYESDGAPYHTDAGTTT